MPEGKGVQFLDQYGAPMQPQRSRVALNGGGPGGRGNIPYDAADIYGQHMSEWRPFLWSPDGEINMYRDRIVSRVRDLVRNDGWASGAVTRILDNAVGGNLRPIPKPDYRWLAQYTGNKAFDHAWAKEYARAIDAYWRTWALDMGRWCDATRNQSFGELMFTGFRHKLIDGDALAVMQYIPERLGYGRAHYATAVQLVDPDRLSNPQLRFDSMTMRGGVEIDSYGAAIAYHIRKAHAGDWFSARESLTWERVPRETDWGRPVVVHDFDGDRASQNRGGAGIFAPVLQRLKMLVRYDGAELDSALINAIFAAYIESPFDQQMVQEALDDGEHLNYYQQERVNFHAQSKLALGNARIPIMFPGEKINTVNSSRPSDNFKPFENAVLRNVAAGVGLSAQQISNDWSDVNYSSARGALLEAWKTIDRRRDDFTLHFASPIRGCVLEEVHAMEDVPLPNGAPDFAECRTAYCRAKWLGPARGWIDPTSEAQAAILRMDGALSTLEDECAQQGLDFEDVLEQRRYEIGLFTEYGIPLPEWSGIQPIPANETKKPK
jgi:lambda family phage portal protein